MTIQNAMETEKKDMLSVVIPAFNEEKMIALSAETITDVLQSAGIEYEIIFIDDGSKDGTWEKILAANSNNPLVRGGQLSRNFGKEGALRAGLALSKGDCVVTMDCDLQNPPEILPQMYSLWMEGYEVIEGIKKSRGTESVGYNLMSRTFYSLMSNALHTDMSRASDFKLLDRKAVLALLNIQEQNIFYRAMSCWIGFRTTTIEFDVHDRVQGKSKWSKWNLIRYAIKNITSFTMLPLHLVLLLGTLMLIVSIIAGLEVLHSYFNGTAQNGFTTVILLQLFIGSITVICLGVIGYYISRIFDEVRARPHYILDQTTDQNRREND